MPWDDEPEPVTQAVPVVQPRRPRLRARPTTAVTEPIRARAEHLLHAPAETWHSDPIESWRHFPRDDEPEEPEPASDPEPRTNRGAASRRAAQRRSARSNPKSEPIGFAHNGFHVDEERFQPLPPPAPEEPGRRATNALRGTTWPRTNRRRGSSGSSPTAGIPATTTPTTRRGTAGIRCRVRD